MGPAKIKRWFEKRGVPIQGVEVLKTPGAPVLLGYKITTKAGKNGQIGPASKAHDLENLRRLFIKV